MPGAGLEPARPEGHPILKSRSGPRCISVGLRDPPPASRLDMTSRAHLGRSRHGRPLNATRLYHVIRVAGERAGIGWAVGLHESWIGCRIQTINDTQITGNTATVSAPSGTAAACCGGASAADTSTVRDSLISGNQLTATTSTGSANARGAGVGNPFGAMVEIRDTTISDNTGTASGPSGTAQGGGVFTGSFFEGDQPGQLNLINSAITHNTLTASPGITIQGGGLFTNGPLTLNNTAISHNLPDQCFGC